MQWVERVGVDHDERMIVSVIGLGTDGDFLGIPLDGKFRHDSRKEAVRGGIPPQDEVVLADIIKVDVAVGFHTDIAPELLTPVGDGTEALGFLPRSKLIV